MKLSVVNIATTAQQAQNLVRPCVAGAWAAADTDMKEVWILKPGSSAFVPLVGSSWKRATSAMVSVPWCSRVYLPSIVRMPDGSAIVGMKMGPKEVEDSGVPFDKTAWGLYVLRITAAGRILWGDQYRIHKGNGQVVADPRDASKVWLIATEGLRWTLSAQNGSVLGKDKVPMGRSGEKCYSTSTSCCCVGYTNNPSGMARFGIDTKPVPWATKPPLELGPDQLYARCLESWHKPAWLWAVMAYGGQLRYNYVRPRKTEAKLSPANPGRGGSAVTEDRFAPSLFRLQGDKKHIGVAFVDGGAVRVQVLNQSSTRTAVAPGHWPVAQTDDSGRIWVSFFDGNVFKTAEIVYTL